ncbi:ECF transporter S component [Streptococcus sp. HF-1907]|uniref:ECF transporter S component n=1 Tax=Streptococcus sp. HF-1907 TaxID=2785793 RepID=UPI0018A10059|nr:ECF transporter S component [Streptococcus sp. HF-1907]MBF7094918.1 ECF transporter S component [Streptococcus sp. HF-1907]
MRQTKTRELTLLAVLTALSVVLGKFLSLPTPTGFVTLLDAGVIFTALYLGKRQGAIVGAASGFLIDLIGGYASWMFFSLLIHGAQGYLAGLTGKWRYLGIVGTFVVMVGGYALARGILYGWAAALPGMAAELMQNLVGLIAGYALNLAFSRFGGK